MMTWNKQININHNATTAAAATVIAASICYWLVIVRLKSRRNYHSYNMLEQQGTTKARILAPTKENLRFAANELQQGKLVAFPTETVFGLGANALNSSAVLNIFKSKGRPLTDPLIVHVPTLDAALNIVDLSPKDKLAFIHLAKTFWPGPLTMVARAAKHIPSMVCAETGFVGVRIPCHPIAQELLSLSNVPVAAPSANRFGHVSPTTAQHVFDDLFASPITIIEDNNQPQQNENKVGIESTVLKVHGNQFILFRKGGISEESLKQALNEGGFNDISIIVPIRPKPNLNEQEVESSHEAPGQLLTHYSPDVPSYLVAYEHVERLINSNSNNPMDKTVLIDFGEQLLPLKSKCLAYRDLSPSGNSKEAARTLFDTLRWCEHVPNCTRVIIAEVSNLTSKFEPSVADAVYDRIYRAASGKII